jgi:hypothetical protein
MTRFFLIATVLFLDSSHLPAPIALAWAHPEFRRQIALEHKLRYIAIPLAVLALAVLTVPATLISWPGFRPIIGTKVGVVGEPNFVLNWLPPGHWYSILGWLPINPFTALLTLFLAWNLYHFGSQNFGLWRMWRRGQGNRLLQKSSWLGGTVAGMVGTPFVAPVLVPLSMWAFGLWHWLPAIWLAAKASRRPVLFWTGSGVAGAIISVGLWAGVARGTLAVAMTVVAARLGLGFVHFLYDRWVWRLSDPVVRVMIGGDVFSPRHSPFRV